MEEEVKVAVLEQGEGDADNIIQRCAWAKICNRCALCQGVSGATS